MGKDKSRNGLSQSYAEIEGMQNEYLRQLDGLSKIFISLSAAILGLTLSLIGLKLRQQQGITWIVATWVSLLMTALAGFFQVYSLSKRFRHKAEYLHACLLTDAVVETQGSEEKLNEFIWKSDQADKRFKRSYYWCAGSVLAQGIFLLLSFLFFGMFIWVNFAAKPTP
jgi:hypothetical protein